MESWLKDGINRIVELAEVEKFDIRGKTYTSKGLVPLKEPLPEKILVSTLTGFVDYYKNCDVDFGERPVVYVWSPTGVSLMSTLVGPFEQRKVYIEANAILPSLTFGQYQPLEDFIVSLQSRFVENDDVKKILKIVGNIEDKNIRKYTDDGVTQAVSATVGIARVDNVPVPRVVKLAPYRTFLEIKQPESPFILRMRQGKDGAEPACALFEADGGKWKNDAILGIKAYLKKELPKATILA